MQIIRFTVRLLGTDVWRQIEMRASHTLEEFHTMIQEALDWDGAHLYSFFMSGEPWDSASEYTLPTDALEEDVVVEDLFEGMLDLDEWKEMDEKKRTAILAEFEEVTGLPGSTLSSLLDQAEEMQETAEQETEAAGDVQTTTLRALKLQPGQRFLYLFDYGDEHHFDVHVDDVIPFSDPDALYPAIVDGDGEAPDQYGQWLMHRDAFLDDGDEEE